MLHRLLIALLALMPLLAAAQTPGEPQEGLDYVVLATPQRYADAAGKIEVAEVFGYSCIHCANLQPLMDSWLRDKPVDVDFRYVPAIFGGVWAQYGRAYFTAEQLGLLERTHADLFRAIHEEHRFGPSGAGGNTAALADFYAGYGGNREAFIAAMASDTLNEKLRYAHDFARNAGVEGTPTLIVNGKYRVVSRNGYPNMLRTVDWLVERERAAAKL